MRATLGATHTINHARRTDVVAEIRKITGDGVRFSLETSAQPAVLREAVEALMPAGTCVLLGSARTGTEVSLDMPFLQFGRVVRGVIQGESHPQEFIPKLVDFLMEGRMPVDRMMTFYRSPRSIAPQRLQQRHDDQAGAAHAALIKSVGRAELCETERSGVNVGSRSLTATWIQRLSVQRFYLDNSGTVIAARPERDRRR